LLDSKKSRHSMFRLALLVMVPVLLSGCSDEKPGAFKKGTTMEELKAKSAKIAEENARKEAMENPLPLPVSTATLRRAWPFTVPSGSIVCLSHKRIVFKAGDKTYALNGIAREVAGANSWAAIEDIWKFDSKNSQYRVSTGEIMTLAASHCRV
jgi:hypothetical protein